MQLHLCRDDSLHDNLHHECHTMLHVDGDLGKMLPVTVCQSELSTYRLDSCLSYTRQLGHAAPQVDKDLREMLVRPDAPAAKTVGVRVWPKAIPQFNVAHLDTVQARRPRSPARLQFAFTSMSGGAAPRAPAPRGACAVCRQLRAAAGSSLLGAAKSGRRAEVYSLTYTALCTERLSRKRVSCGEAGVPDTRA